MGTTFEVESWIALRRAGEVLIRALSATTAEEEADFRLRADSLIRDAVSHINHARVRQDRLA